MRYLKLSAFTLLGFMVLALSGTPAVMAHGKHDFDGDKRVAKYVMVKPGFGHHYSLGKRTLRHHDKFYEVYGPSHHKRRPVPLRKRFSSHRPLYQDHYRDGLVIRLFRSFD